MECVEFPPQELGRKLQKESEADSSVGPGGNSAAAAGNGVAAAQWST